MPLQKAGAEFLPFDSIKHTFDIQGARTRYEYICSKYRHQSYMASLDETVRSGDIAKELIVSEEIKTDIEGTISEQSSDNLNTAVTLESEK